MVTAIGLWILAGSLAIATQAVIMIMYWVYTAELIGDPGN